MLQLYDFKEPCSRCEAVAWERLGLFRTSRGKEQDVIACCFCGYRLRVKAKPVAATGSGYVFESGRFAGLTVEQVAQEPNGMKYLEVVRKNDKRIGGEIDRYMKTVAPQA